MKADLFVSFRKSEKKVLKILENANSEGSWQAHRGNCGPRQKDNRGRLAGEVVHTKHRD
jgi:hypothetical protein